MPYIIASRREDLMSGNADPMTPGELNYVITELIQDYLWMKNDESRIGYADLNEVIGVLESCKLEFYRRLCAMYEDSKMAENGDCYDDITAEVDEDE